MELHLAIQLIAREDAAEREVGQALAAIAAHATRFGRGPAHEDLRQRLLIKVHRHAPSFQGATAAAAAAWLRQIHSRLVIDHHRRAARERARPLPPEELDAVVAETEDEEAFDPEVLTEWIEGPLMDQVDAFLAEHVARPLQRARHRRHAQVTILRKVRKLERDAILATLPEGDRPKPATLDKWVERGRDKVLLPALERWEAEEEAQETPRPSVLGFVHALRELLVEGRRSDHGKPRKTTARGGSVSPPPTGTSVQCAGATATSPTSPEETDDA